MDVGAVEKVHPRYINIVSINAVPGSALYRFFPCIISVKNASDALNMTMNMIQDEKGLSKLVVESVPQPTSQNCEMLQNEMNVVSQTDQNIEININTPSEGWFFAANTFYPGWKAYLDSNPVSLYHGNYLFMAIKVPEGFHKIIFTYKPFSFFTGFIISGSILFLIFSFILWRGSKYIYFRE